MPVPEQPVKPQILAYLQGISPEAAQLLLQKQAESIPASFRQQGQHIVRAHRPAGLPERFQPMNMGLSDWERFKREQESRRQEEESRSREQQRQAELIQQQARQKQDRQQAEENRWLEQKRSREREEFKHLCRELHEEIRNLGFDQIANDIVKDWRSHSSGVPISVSPKSYARVKLNDDGTIKEKESYSGSLKEISYTYTTKRPYEIHEEYVDEEGGRQSSIVETGIKDVFDNVIAYHPPTTVNLNSGHSPKNC